jgi:hypothetical protein
VKVPAPSTILHPKKFPELRTVAVLGFFSQQFVTRQSQESKTPDHS